ncbi:P1 family peptidase [Bacillus mycoides]|uniref:Aminopeptidase n=1 Tax=Bacillus cereus TaxID=1396 RepID=A0AA44Q811_BACCE|nr:D-aminopeptidase [Bacillus cereus Rock3-44]PFA22506.1 aminopeptidase [Bacillus cereus]PFN05072.1 aminopeptidase [Bacillus cereus]PFR26662.1 aminopeptidase [Bacillus cereus]PFR98614.1 aminopeptidase [Bacillus cereus]
MKENSKLEGRGDIVRKRLRELGVVIGKYETGLWNAITDVEGVQVGHVTLFEKGNVRTGVTAILPHSGNVFYEKVFASSYVINGFGKTVGTIQVQELGTIESQILVTNTLSVAATLQGTIQYMLRENEEIGQAVGTVNVVIGECNDGYLNDIRGMHVKPEHAIEAIEIAQIGPVAEGCVGAGTGMACFGYKGGVGTSSRIITFTTKTYTLGVLVVTNFGRKEDLYRKEVDHKQLPDGSIMIIIATDAPLSERQLNRIAKRATFGLAKAGSYGAHGSGDIVIAFSTAHHIPHTPAIENLQYSFLREDGKEISHLFAMTIEAVEEAIWNALCMAKTTSGNGKCLEEIPYAKVKDYFCR